jgi:Cu/Ag efflux protein CusF
MRLTIRATLVVLMAAAPALAADAVKHIGTVTAVDAAAHRITLDEAGAARGPDIKLGRYAAQLDPGAQIALVERADMGTDGWPGGFVERPLGASDVRPGDYVTLTVEQRGGKPVVTRVEVVRPRS